MEERKEEKKQNGGAREGAGRKTKAVEDNVTEVFLSALKEVYSTESDFETKKAFTKDLISSQRGQIFIAEHLFGKPEQIVNQNVNLNDFQIKDVIQFNKG